VKTSDNRHTPAVDKEMRLAIYETEKNFSVFFSMPDVCGASCKIKSISTQAAWFLEICRIFRIVEA
jgi:hypothetical protein